MSDKTESIYDQPLYNTEDLSSKRVFELRREKKIEEAYKLATALLKIDHEDEWNKRAMAWVLIDLIKREINKNPQIIIPHFKQLISLSIQDELIEAQIKLLQSKLTPINGEIERLSTLSKDGNYLEALNQFRSIFAENTNLPQAHHDAYGWAIYRYLKNHSDSLTPIEIKKILFEYNQLQSERPSMLHSQILRFVINYVRYNNQDIDIYRYFLNWGPQNLQDEDVKPNTYKEKTYPPLLDNLIRTFIYSPSYIDFNLLDQKITIWYDLSLLDIYREAVFWELFNAHKENQYIKLWQLFEQYAVHYSHYGPSHWHSEILNLAQRVMIENDLWRFPAFLYHWNLNNFQNTDWQGEIYNDRPTKSLVAKALSHINEYAKVANNPQELEWILPFYKQATDHLEDNIWLLRGYSNLLSLMGKDQEAIKIYNEVLLNLNNQAYAWHELARLIKNKDINLAHSMLCMAISKQPKEEFLGNIRLDLAEIMINNDALAEAKRELVIYKEFRLSNNFKIPDRFNALYKTIENDNIEPAPYDKAYYEDNSKDAEEYLYQDIAWQPFLIYHSWNNKNNEKMIAITNLENIELAFKKSRFPITQHSNLKDVISCKVYFDKAKDRYSLLLAKNSDVTYNEFIDKAPSAIAVVDHINQNKKLFHYYFTDTIQGIIRFSDTNLRPTIGDCISIRYFMSYNSKSKKKEAKVIEVEATLETNPDLIKIIQGTINLKYKYEGRTLEFDEALNENLDLSEPDFAFIEDCYVHRKILKKHKINSNRVIEAKIMKQRGKWSVIDLK